MMYRIVDFYADALVDIELLFEENVDKEIFTRWELCSGEIDMGDVEYEFENKPSKEEVHSAIEQLFIEYVERVMSTYTVDQMTMSIYDERESMMNDEGLNWEDVLTLSWGKIICMASDVMEYEIEEI